MIDIINAERNEKLLQDLAQFKLLLEKNDSDLTQEIIDQETYKLNNIFIMERIEEIERLLSA